MAELTIRPEEIRGALDAFVQSYEPGAASREEVGRVADAGDGIAHVEGLPSVMANELLKFEDGTLGIALNLDVREIGVVVLGEFSGIEEGQEVRRTGEVLSVPVGDGFLGEVEVDHRSGEVGVVGGQVEVTVAAQRGEDDGLLAGLLGLQRLTDRHGQGVGGLGSGDDALGAGELDGGREALRLRHSDGIHQPELVDVGDQRRHAVVAEAAGVDRVGDEVMPEGVHLHQRRHACGVAEVVGVHAPGQRGAGCGLHREDARVDLAGHLLLQEGEGQAREVGSAAGAADDERGGVPRHLHLQQGLLADDRLVQEHVVQHRAERVAGVRVLGSDLDGLGDRDAQRTRPVLRIGCERSADLGQVGGRPVHAGSERLDHQAAVRLRVVGRSDLPHLALKVVQRAGEGQRRAPLAGAGLGGELGRALLLVVVRLRHGRVRLVGAGRRDALVLVVDARRGAERLLELVGAVQRRRPPLPVHVEHPARDIDVPLGRDLLHDQFHREQRREVVRSHGIHSPGMQRRRRRLREVGHDVVPGGGHLVLGQRELVLPNAVIHGIPPFEECRFACCCGR